MTFNFASLQTDVLAWMENNSVELSASEGTCINMAITTMSRDLRVKALNVYDTSLTMTANSPTLAIPDVGTMLSMRSISYNVSGTKYTTLIKKELTYLDEYWPDRGISTPTPKYYGVLNDTEWFFAGVPNASFALRVAYRRQLAQLVDDDDTNSIITNHYDFALTACLVEASRFVIDDRQNGLVQFNLARYAQLLTSVNEAEKRTERDEMRHPELDMANLPSAPPDSETE